MKRTNWFVLALALACSANCRVDSNGLVLVSGAGAGSGGESGTGTTPDSESTPSGTGGQDEDGATSLGGTSGSGGAPGLDAAAGSGDAPDGGGTSGSGGRGSGGIITLDCAADTGGASSTGGWTGLGGDAASGGVQGTGGVDGTGGSPNPDGAIDKPISPGTDAPPEVLADTSRDVPADKRAIDTPASPGDTRDGVDAVRVDSGTPMTLVWSDEFNGTANTGVDATKWSYVTWDPGQVNNEVQKYTSRLANVFQDGSGNLVIRALDTPYAGNTYTSGRIESRGHFAFRYGRVEVNAKLPAGIGSFPGIIAMGSTGTWPQCGELALLEQYGQDKSWFYVSATAGGASDTGNVQYTFPNPNTSTSSDFHVYSVDWYTDHIVFQVDGNEITRMTFTASSPFATIQEYLVLDLALGGTMGGTIDPDAFPMEMVVDYVRVYSF